MISSEMEVHGCDYAPANVNFGEEAWLKELVRVTNPEGILYVTTLNDATWSKASQRSHFLIRMEKANKIPGNIPITPELFEKPMPTDRLVIRWSHVMSFTRIDTSRKTGRVTATFCTSPTTAFSPPSSCAQKGADLRSLNDTHLCRS